MKTKFIILTQHRSGSTNLMTILSKNKGLHCDAECLKKRKKELNRNGGVYTLDEERKLFQEFYDFEEDEVIKGFRVFPRHFIDNIEMNSLAEDKDIKIIYLRRNNLLQHVYSIFVAFVLRKFHVKEHNKDWYSDKEQITLDLNYVGRRIKWLKRNHKKITKFLTRQKRDFIEVNYETLYEEETLNRIYDYLDYKGERNYKGDFVKTNSKESREMLLTNKDEVNEKFSNEENGYL
jgi:LPS sulfotransferase NodH